MANFIKKVINTLRVVPAKLRDLSVITDKDLIEGVTLNENINTLGFTFNTESLVKVASVKDKSAIYETIKSSVLEVKADPMYPDFPSQVMSMSEAEYRFHQIAHYFSTYGIESLFGVNVSKGWLPDTESTPKTKEDKHILPDKVLEVIDEKELDMYIIKTLAQRKVRLTDSEREILEKAFKNIVTSDNFAVTSFDDIKISFKENLEDIFVIVMDNARSLAKYILPRICQHTGDVLKCTKHYLDVHHFKISTSQKKAIVKTLETFDVNDFKENLMFSNSRREEIIVILQYLDYNIFSRSDAHKTAVAQLRNNELTSWYGELEKAFKEDLKKAIQIMSKRPGEFLRRVNRSLKLGIPREDIIAGLSEKADALSLPTLVRLNTLFGSTEMCEKEFQTDVFYVINTLLYKKLATINTDISGKKVFIDEDIYSFEDSIIETNDKSSSGEYIPSGIAFKIPEEAKRIRFFTYWNDKDRVDIDLHAKGVDVNGERFHVGWNSSYKSRGLVMSGDITHSNAAEYIDIDLKHTNAKAISMEINSYTRDTFKDIDIVLTGVMAVSELGEEKDVKLYTPANAFFSHELNSDMISMCYGYIDIKRKVLRFVGKSVKTNIFGNEIHPVPEYTFTLTDYLNALAKTQNIEFVTEKEDADISLRLDKARDENEISLIDNNFFMDV